MHRNPTIPSLIKTHLESGKMKYLEAAVMSGYEKLPRTKYYIKLLKKGFLKLSEDYFGISDLFASLSYLEYARKLTPFDPRLLSKEIDHIKRIINRYTSDLIKKDLQLLQGVIRFLSTTYRKRFPNIIKDLESIDRLAKASLEKAKKVAEGKHTFRIEKFFCNLYDDLTPEEQANLFADIIAPEVLREIGEKLKKEKEEKAPDE